MDRLLGIFAPMHKRAALLHTVKQVGAFEVVRILFYTASFADTSKPISVGRAWWLIVARRLRNLVFVFKPLDFFTVEIRHSLKSVINNDVFYIFPPVKFLCDCWSVNTLGSAVFSGFLWLNGLKNHFPLLERGILSWTVLQSGWNFGYFVFENW